MRYFILFLSTSGFVFSQLNLSTLVNPFVGTAGHGHTFPGTTAPFGMVQLSPDTRIEGWDACSGYHYSDSSILGFSHTHLSGTGVPDYGDILLMPMVRKPRLEPSLDRSSFSHEQESATAGWYHVLLTDDSIAVDLTATTRVGIHRYRFPKTDSAFVIIDLHHGLGPDVVIKSWMQKNGNTEISGFRRSTGWARDQNLYFSAQFSLPILQCSITNNNTIAWSSDTAQGTNVKAVIAFDTRTRRELVVKVALSSVSADGARQNLLAEAPGWNFDALAMKTRTAWDSALGVIEAVGGSETDRRTFYTALYHCMIAPNTFSDADGRYRGMDGIVHSTKDRTHYTVFSLWDTFRALHPLMTIIDERRTAEFINTFLAQYDESGLLPVWELCSNETYCMIGYHSVSVIADAVGKNIPGFDRKHALQAMVTSAEKDHFGLSQYRSRGYVPSEKESESVSKTLEYAYDDWCIASTADKLGVEDLAKKFYRRSMSYRNVFDPSVGFMRGKKNSMWSEPFSPSAVSLDFTEANSWQYSFFVPHDIDGMMELYGGRLSFIQKLDDLFSVSSTLEGRQQSDITGLIGQYAHGNEPSHHMAYLFTYAGAPWKTQERTRQILQQLYSDKPDGLSGNEDCGQMSAWYVMSAMGLYQVAPGKPEYVLTSPIFDSVIVRLQNGKRFTISTRRNTPEDIYIQSVSKNGKALADLFISHADILDGSSLVIELSSSIAKRFTMRKQSAAPKTIPFTAVPYFTSAGISFRETNSISIHAAEKGAKLYYTIDGTTPTRTSELYRSPIVIDKSTTLRAIAVRNEVSSAIAEASFTKTKYSGSIKLGTRYSDQYTAGGDEALIDGLIGGEDFRIGHWQGYEGNDLTATVDLEQIKMVERISARFLQDINAWIFFPTQITIEISFDGTVYDKIFSGTIGIPPDYNGAIIKSIEQRVNKQIRYVRIHAKNIGVCPPWHKGSGGKAWLFSDEIEIY
ncbi:MAG: GH92 family glycosyl hydrolase [Bacteroidota bacterium]